ncbi:MAG: hypothetical protein D6759_18770 [Chloroflexi bacterium]|nr:MAG: hypothetical protein D6759_18770 [Chloroflexota bacterium]
MVGYMWIPLGVLTGLSVVLLRVIPPEYLDAAVADIEERMEKDGGEPGILGVLVLAILVVALTLYLAL